VIGMVLAAGVGSRLGDETAELPKTLIGVDGHRTILDIALANFAHVGLSDAVIVTGYAHDRLAERVPELERRHGVTLELVFNPKAKEWNNCYSLWCARAAFAEGVLLANGDTVHPVSVEETLLAARGGPALLLAVDTEKQLAEEEMKVRWSAETGLQRITKLMAPETAYGEYIGVTLIEPEAAAPLTAALETTWRGNPDLYYEDGYQELVDRGFRVDVAPIGSVDWVEIDDLRDLERARELACRS
jgi:choline kinase